MTVAEKIQTASVEVLADFLTKLMSAQRTKIIEALQALGVVGNVGLIEMPMMTRAALLDLLLQEVEEI